MIAQRLCLSILFASLFSGSVSAGDDPCAPITDAEWAKVAKAVPNVVPAALARWRPYTIREVESLHAPPAELGNRPLAELGYVDVAAAPFNVDVTGAKDVTVALQAAIDYASRHRMATYLPPGDYLVSNTIELYQPVTMSEDGALRRSENGNLMEGSTAEPGKRARIVLAPKSPGFGDPGKPKLVVYVHNVKPPLDTTETEDGAADAPADAGGEAKQKPPAKADPKLKKKAAKQGKGEDQAPAEANTLTYNLIFRSIDITLGPGNRGAVALRMQGAEGCTIQDVKIDATHGHVGLWGAPASGGSTHGLTVLGGDIGIETRSWPDRRKPGCQPSPSFSGLTLLNQRQYAIAVLTRGACVAVGCRLVRDTPGALVLLHRHWQGQPYDGSLGLIDSVLEYAAPDKGNVVIENVQGDEPAEDGGKPQGRPRSYYFNNVFVKNAAAVDSVSRQPAGGSGWNRFRELAVSFQPQNWHERQFLERIYLDGKPLGKDRLVDEQPGVEPPGDLLARHALPNPLPSAAWPTAVSIQRYAKLVVDGDWAAAVQAAVNENEIVALPADCFSVRSTIQLKPNTMLLGVHPIWSCLQGVDEKDRRFGGARDSAGADPTLAAGSAVAAGQTQPLGSTKAAANRTQSPAALPIIATADDPNAQTMLGFVGLRAAQAVSSHSPEPLAVYRLLWRSGGRSVVDMLDYANLRGEGGKNYYMAYTMPMHFGLAQVASPATDPDTGLQLASTDPKQPRLLAETETGEGKKKMKKKAKKKKNNGGFGAVVALTTPFGRNGCGIALSAGGKPFDLEELQVCHAVFDQPDFAVTIVGKRADGTSVERKVEFAAGQRLEPQSVALGWKKVTEVTLSAPRPFGLCGITADGKTSDLDEIEIGSLKLQKNDMRHGFEHFPFSPQVHPMILITGNGGGRWYNFWRHGDIWAQEGYRQVVVKDNKSPLAIYHWHLQHVHSAAQAGFEGARDVSVYGIKHEHQTCFLETVRSDRIRIFGSGGLSNAAQGSAHFRFIDTPNYLVSNLADEIHLKANDRNIHNSRNPLVENDPSRYAGVQDILNGKMYTDQTEDPKQIDRPILWQRGDPNPP